MTDLELKDLAEKLFEAYKHYNVKPPVPDPADKGIYTWQALALGMSIKAICEDLIERNKK